MNRRCSTCGNEYPLTHEYFHNDARGLNGFSPRCKTCANKYQRRFDKTEKAKATRRKQEERYIERHSEIDPRANSSKLKHCGGCDRTLSVTEFYVNRRRCDGLYVICKACKKKKDNEYKAKNPDSARANRKKWRDANPELSRRVNRNSKHRREARIANLLVDFTEQDWQYALEYFHHRCAICGRQMNDLFNTLTVAQDHWMPVAKGGHYIPENIIPLCHGLGGCNNAKSAKDPAQWLIDTYGSRRANAILAKVETFFSTVRRSTEEKSA